MDMTSNASNSTAAASAPNNNQQEAVVSSPTRKEQANRNPKKARAAQQQAGGSGEPRPRPPQDAALSCPRCCSTNTKFCYYNNYNLTQPRYFCKTCRRYWTQGGTLRNVPVGGGCRRNKRASGSGSGPSSPFPGPSSTAATSAAMEKTVSTRLMLMATSTMAMPSPTTGLFVPDDMPPAFTPTTGGSGFDLGLDLAMDEQQGFLPFSPLSLSDQAPELAPGGGSDTTPSFLDMLTGGYLDGGGLAMSGGSDAMDMPFPLPEMGAPTTDPVPFQLQWTSSELDNYINDDGGYAAGPAAAGVQQQHQVVGDQQKQDENKEAGNSKGNGKDDDGGSSSVYSFWINTSTSDGAEG